MDNTGIKKDIDKLGRFVIPKSIITTLDLKTLEICIDGEDIVLKKVNVEYCAFCEDKSDLIEFKNKHVCRKCVNKIKEL